MASRTDHVIVRDGSRRLSEPRPAPPARGNVQPKAAPTTPPKGLGPPYSSDDSVVGHFEIGRAGFEGVRGSNTTPRHKLEASKPQPANPEDREALAKGIANPLE